MIKNHPNCRSTTGIKFFADQKDCTSYYSCVDGTAIRNKCPLDLEFNAVELLCDYPSNAGCSVIKNFKACQAGVESFVPNQHDCHAYYACQKDRTAYKMYCNDELEFNREQLICDYMETANCSFIPQYSSCRVGRESFEPHREDCGSYYFCLENGDAVRHNCPDGYLFNDVNNMCDYPENVFC